MSAIGFVGGAMPPAFRLPEMSAPLAKLVCLIERGFNTYDPGPVARAEALALANGLAVPCAPAGPVRVLEWLVKLNPGLSLPLDEKAFRIRAKAVAEALASMPTAVFTVETAQAAMRNFEYFPGAAALAGFLSPKADEVRRLLRHLAVAAGSGPVEQKSRRPETQEGVDAVVAAFKPIFDRAERRSAPPPPVAARTADPAPRAVPLSWAALAEAYRAGAESAPSAAQRALMAARAASIGGGDAA